MRASSAVLVYASLAAVCLLGGCPREETVRTQVGPPPADAPHLVVDGDRVEPSPEAAAEAQPPARSALVYQRPLRDVVSVAIDPRGRYLIVGDFYGAAAIVDVETGVIRGHRTFYDDVAHAPETDFDVTGARLLLGFGAADYSEQGSGLYSWDLARDEARWITNGFHQSLYAYAMSPSGSLVAHVDFSQLALTALADGADVARIDLSDLSPVQLAVTGSERRLFSYESSSESASVLVIRDSQTLGPVKTYADVSITAMVPRPTGGAVITLEEVDGRPVARVRGSLEGEVLGTLGAPEHGVSKAVYRPDGLAVALWEGEETARLYDALSGELVSEHRLGAEGAAEPLPLWAFDGSERGLAHLGIVKTDSGLRRFAKDGAVRWEVGDAGRTLRFEGQRWAEQGQELLLWSQKQVVLWTPEGAKVGPRPAGLTAALRTRGDDRSLPHALLYLGESSPEGPPDPAVVGRFVKRSRGSHALRLAAGEDNQVVLYDATDGRVVRPLPGVESDCLDEGNCRPEWAFSPDWQWLAVLDADDNLRVFQVRTGRQTALIEEERESEIVDFAILDGGRGLVYRSDRIVIVPMRNGRRQGEPITLTGLDTYSVAKLWIAGDELIVTGEDEDELMVWNGRGEVVRRLALSGSENLAAFHHLAEDGSLLIRGFYHREAIAVPLPDGEVVEIGPFLGAAPDGGAVFACRGSQLYRETLGPERRSLALGPCRLGDLTPSGDGRFVSVIAGDEVWLYAQDGSGTWVLGSHATLDETAPEVFNVITASDGRYWTEERSLPYFAYRREGPLHTVAILRGDQLPPPVASPAELGFRAP